MNKLKLGTYPYTFARVSAMKGRLIGREQYLKLLKMKISEIIKFLQETEYKKEIDELAVSYSGVDLVERALSKNLASTFQKLKKISDEQVVRLIAMYLKRWDIRDIKTVLRGIVSKADKDYVQSLLIAAGDLSQKLMELFEAGDVEQLISAVGLPKGRFDASLNVFKETGNLFEIENELDKMYYGELLELSAAISGNGKPFAAFLPFYPPVPNGT